METYMNMVLYDYFTLLYFSVFIATITLLPLATVLRSTVFSHYGRPTLGNGTRLFHYPFLATRIPSVVGLDPYTSCTTPNQQSNNSN